MYVCICKAITDKQLEEVQKTSKSLRDICKNLGLGTECGACVQDAIQFLNNANAQQQKSDD